MKSTSTPHPTTPDALVYLRSCTRTLFTSCRQPQPLTPRATVRLSSRPSRMLVLPPAKGGVTELLHRRAALQEPKDRP